MIRTFRKQQNDDAGPRTLGAHSPTPYACDDESDTTKVGATNAKYVKKLINFMLVIFVVIIQFPSLETLKKKSTVGIAALL